MPVSPKALFFDVFGTLVDWRTSIAREAELILKPLGFSLDWLAFADAWRNEYQPGMEEVRSAASRSASSTCCTGETSSASCRALAFPACRRMQCASSIWPGIGSTPGRTCRGMARLKRRSCWRRCRTATSR